MVFLGRLATGLLWVACGWAHATQISVVSTVAVQSVLERLQQDFEHSTSHHVHVTYGSSAALKAQLDDGGAFDVAILTRGLIDDLAKQGKIVGSTARTVARSGIGIAVKAGAAKPAIGTRDELRRALLKSPAIAYPKEGQSGIVAARLLETLGITEEMKGRVYQDPRPAGGLLAVADGKSALAFAALSEIAANRRVELVGPLPGNLQTYVVFGVGLASATREQAACRAFIAFLSSPAARREWRAAGMERP